MTSISRLTTKLKTLLFSTKIRKTATKVQTRLPEYDMLVRFNKIALTLFPDKKSDKHEVLNGQKLRLIADTLPTITGDHYDQAIFLLRRIVTDHVFASGNRRTALLVTIYFLKSNGNDVFINDNPHNSDVLLGIRNTPEFYTDKDLKKWFTTGSIKDYVRQYPKPKNKRTT